MTDGVTSIGENAFFQSAITGVVFPDSVTSIEKDAFSDCERLTSVTIPDSVTSIGNTAFCSCDGLVSVIVGSGVISMGDGDGAFSCCLSLEDITIKNRECDLQYQGTISNDIDYMGGGSYYNGTIHGYKNSTAQAYAEKYGYKFEAIDDEPAVTTTAVTTTSPTTSTTVSTAVSTTAVTTTVPEETTAPATIEQKGDANGDGKVNVRDAAHIAKVLAQGKASELTLDADFNGDGKVNVRDAAAIAKFLATGKR